MAEKEDGSTRVALDQRTLLRVGAVGLASSLGDLTERAHALGATPGGRGYARKPKVLFVFSDRQRAYSMDCCADANARTLQLRKSMGESIGCDT